MARSDDPLKQRRSLVQSQCGKPPGSSSFIAACAPFIDSGRNINPCCPPVKTKGLGELTHNETARSNLPGLADFHRLMPSFLIDVRLISDFVRFSVNINTLSYTNNYKIEGSLLVMIGAPRRLPVCYFRETGTG